MPYRVRRMDQEMANLVLMMGKDKIKERLNNNKLNF